MDRPVKLLAADDEVPVELWRSADGMANAHRERFCAVIILPRLEAVRVEDLARRMNTSARAVSV